MNTDVEDHSLSLQTRATLGQVGAFFTLGFCVLFTIVGTMVRLVFDYIEGNDFAFMFNFEEFLFLLVDGLALGAPVALVCFVAVLFLRRSIEVSTLWRFLLGLAIGLCVLWACLALYGLMTGGLSRLQRFAIFGSYIPPLGLFCGAILWPLRSAFGFKVI